MAFRRQLRLLMTLSASIGFSALCRGDILDFEGNGSHLSQQGLFSFTPGVGNTLTIGAGYGGNGAQIADLINDVNLCSGDCNVIDGYLTLTSGKETSFGGNYQFGAGGSLQIFGEIPSLGLDSSVTLLDAQFAGVFWSPFQVRRSLLASSIRGA
jgi:hypothetical protein